jgi:type III pantothenate kinase
MSCSVPPLRSVFEDLSRQYLHCTPVIVGPGIKTGVSLVSVDNPREVGADRVVNSLATYRQQRAAARRLPSRSGTATVFGIAIRQGEFAARCARHGGLVGSLTRSAAQLFQIELVRPPKAIGKSTVTTMQSGIVLGFAGLVEGLVKRLKAEDLDCP